MHEPQVKSARLFRQSLNQDLKKEMEGSYGDKCMSVHACILVPALHRSCPLTGLEIWPWVEGGALFFVSLPNLSTHAACKPGAAIVSESQVLREILELFGQTVQI